MSKVFITDGMKATNLLYSEDTSVWNYFSNAPKSNQDILFARVAAAFRAYNLKANTVGNMPFVLLKASKPDGKQKSIGIKAIDEATDGDEVDNSATWKNVVGFMPNPSELLRLDTLSYMATNKIYNIQNSDRLGYKPRGLHNAVPYYFEPVVNTVTAQLDYIERTVGTQWERYSPEGKLIGGNTQTPKATRLIYMWRLDHTTEVLPSQNTEALAIASAAGVVYFADFWIRNFFERGGVKPTIVSVKGMVSADKKEEATKDWTDFIRNIRVRLARIVNGDSVTATPFGSGVDDMKDNRIYDQALANIAMGTGMPLSLLMANSANYATAKEEKATWYENDIIPLCNWMAYEYNRQVFEPIGLRLEFHPETLDPQQEDETERASAMLQYASVLEKCPSKEVFMGLASTLGLEVSEDLEGALEKYYADKEQKEKEMQEQMQRGGYVVGSDGKPVPAQVQGKDEPEEDEKEEKKPIPPAKSTKANDTSAMIALRIPDSIRAEIKERYAFVDTETLNNLHITLVYLGDSRTLDKLDIIRAVSDLGMYQAPIKGTLQGLARFVNGQDVDPLVVTFDSPQAPALYNMLCGCLDNYHVPFHKDHGFIPHMTLAYIPRDSEMPIETIEPIEINFDEVYYVDGNVWLPVQLLGYENKTKAEQWTPTLDELNEMRVWQKAATQRHKRGEPLDFEYVPHYGGLPDAIAERIKAALASCQTAEEIKAAFAIEQTVTEAPAYKEPTLSADPAILELAAAINKLAEGK